MQVPHSCKFADHTQGRTPASLHASARVCPGNPKGAPAARPSSCRSAKPFGAGSGARAVRTALGGSAGGALQPVTRARARAQVQGAARQVCAAPAGRPPRAHHHRRGAGGHGVRDGRGQDHARARPQRLRGRPAAPRRGRGVHKHPGRRRHHQRARRALCRPAALPGPRARPTSIL